MIYTNLVVNGGNLIKTVKVNLLSNIAETAINILVPLIIIPYLISSLGQELYGEYVTIIAKSALFVVIFELGFGMYFSKQVSINRNDKKLINDLFIVFLSFKLFFSLVSYVFLVLLADTSEMEQVIISFLIAAQLINIAPIISGLEHYGLLVKVQVTSKLFMLAMVFLTDFKSYGVEKALTIQAFTWLFVSLILIIIYINKFKISFKPISFDFVKLIFKSSLPFYGAKIIVNIYQQSSTYFVSFFLTSELVAIYSVAIQLYKVGQAIIAAVAKVIYTSTVKTKDFRLVFKVTKYSLLVHVLILPFVVFCGEWMLSLVFDFEVATLYLLSLILYCSLFFVVFSAYWGYPIMSAINKDNYAHFGILLSSLAYALSFFIIYLMDCVNIYSVVFCILIADIVGMAVRVFYVNKFDVIKTTCQKHY